MSCVQSRKALCYKSGFLAHNIDKINNYDQNFNESNVHVLSLYAFPHTTS